MDTESVYHLYQLVNLIWSATLHTLANKSSTKVKLFDFAKRMSRTVRIEYAGVSMAVEDWVSLSIEQDANFFLSCLVPVQKRVRYVWYFSTHS
ncbi:hypothetical protein TUM4445_19240 [Shewanella sp. MBTL60-112-B2]|nr:hypothetical protein TUM4444_15640 [Shewanella sp. MBTL60-112-B1]GIU32920.1 hypothetical protein TUM4445_19240 [Shewanella sp. MBTL60-112-B2]